MDSIIQKYAEKKHLNDINASNSSTASFLSSDVDDGSTLYFYFEHYESCAARKTCTMVRFIEKQLDFFDNLFEVGEQTKSKLSAEQMVQRMKKYRFDGKLYFPPSE